MSQSIRELLTELAWIEDSIRLTPASIDPIDPSDPRDPSTDERGVNPELLALVERERQIISELRASSVRHDPAAG